MDVPLGDETPSGSVTLVCGIHEMGCNLGFHFRTCQITRMPSRNRLTVALTFKQFLSAIFLRIFPIQNLEPSAVLALRDVRPELLLGNDALQVKFADTLKQRCSVTVNAALA